MPGDHCEYEDSCRVEIRERRIGWSDMGRRVYVREWTSVYDEANDTYVWTVVPQEGKP